MNKPLFINMGVSPSKSDIPTKIGDTPILINRGVLIRGQYYARHKLHGHRQFAFLGGKSTPSAHFQLFGGCIVRRAPKKHYDTGVAGSGWHNS